MKKTLFKGSLVLLAMALLSGCAEPSPNRISKVQETNYPDGISVSIYDGRIKEGVVVSDARMGFGKSKSQVQLILNNNSDDTYNLAVSSEWSDKRGIKISTYPRVQNIRLVSHSGKRMIIDAPNFKAKNVIVNVECGNNCVVKEK